MNEIEQAVSHLKQEAMKRAERFARDTVMQVHQLLTASNNDLHVAAPYPSGLNMDRAQYRTAVAKYQMFQQLTTWRKGSVGLHDPCYADVDPEKVEKYVQAAREDAATQYDAYVAKLIKKIGPVKLARLEGNHVWSYSFLHVETKRGMEVWKTQMILNHSKYGKVFNQFPTRKVKR